MQQIIPIFILIPLLGFLINAIIPKENERRLAEITFVMLGLQFVSVAAFTLVWWWSDEPYLYRKWMVLLQLDGFELYIDFLFDEVTAVFLLVGAFIAFLITTYSRNYLHREDGFKRFFTTILFFYLGYNIIVLSGNLTTVFIGWEIIGIASFLLIAYYRNRFIPVKNAVKIFTLYRLGDVALILALWLSHQIWHGNISLHFLSDTQAIIDQIKHYPYLSLGFAAAVLIASAIKSAQFPFSSWLSRAMEGPTPSSAIFYSSLSVHLGILGLLRTYNFWIHIPWMKEVVIASGFFSFVLSMLTARIQPSVKGQLAYSIVAQIGIMSIEVAMGWHMLALIHFISHSLLRSYQLLISPSIVTYAIRKQFFTFKPTAAKSYPRVVSRVMNTIYVLSLNEWYLDSLIYYTTWKPFKTIGKLIHRIPTKAIRVISILLLLLVPVGVILSHYMEMNFGNSIIAVLVAFIALVYNLRAFTEKERLLYAWYNIGMYHVLLVIAAWLNGIYWKQLLFYIAGIGLAYIVGHLVMNTIRRKKQYISLSGYHGHCYEYPQVEFWFLLASLGLIAFPITSAFVGIELIFNSVDQHQTVLLIALVLGYFINGLTMIRMYARIFLGPHVKTYHTQARKSS